MSANIDTIPTQHYVLGFAFTSDKSGAVLTAKNTMVLLIEKQKPLWQAGRLNGVGGKVEPGEEPLSAMVREFKEETDLDTTTSDWINYHTISGTGFHIEVYACYDKVDVVKAKTMTIEQVVPVETFDLVIDNFNGCISNLGWLITQALDPNVQSGRILKSTTFYG